MTPTLTARLRAVLTAEVRAAADYADFVRRRDDGYSPPDRHAAWQAVILQAIAPVLEPAWQDISTAPKDGTMVRLWFTLDAGYKARETAGYWNREEHVWFSDEPDIYVAIKPTHWMPLPLPPATEPRA